MKKDDEQKSNTELLLEILVLLRVLSRTLVKLQNTTPADFPYYESFEVRRRYGISARTLRRWAQQHLVTRIKKAGRSFYKKHDIDDLAGKRGAKKE